MIYRKINFFISLILLFGASLSATHHLPLSAEFVEYHLKAASEEIEDDYIFYLIEQNIINLDNASTCNEAANELINLLDEGYIIDPFNMARLIGLLDHANPCDHATKVIIKAIECKSPITAEHLTSMIILLDHANPCTNVTKILVKAIQCNVTINEKHLATLITLLSHANPTNKVTTILLKAIECGVKFGPKERFLLAEASKMATARGNVEKIRKALHEKEKK